MCGFLKKDVVLLILIILICSFGEIKADDKNKPKIPFKLTEPIIFNILLKDKHNNDVEVKITFQEYTPPLELNQTFGLEWKDLDFSTVEQNYLGIVLCKTQGQYLSLFHGKMRQDMEEMSDSSQQFEQELKKEREKYLVTENYSTYYSKCTVETTDKKYVLAKRMLKFKGKKVDGVKICYYVGKKWKYSDQFEEDFPHSSIEFFVAYRDKNTPSFLEWLRERQTKVEMENMEKSSE